MPILNSCGMVSFVHIRPVRPVSAAFLSVHLLYFNNSACILSVPGALLFRRYMPQDKIQR
jgi:hypothetical protein